MNTSFYIDLRKPVTHLIAFRVPKEVWIFQVKIIVCAQTNNSLMYDQHYFVNTNRFYYNRY